jgi:RNA polymerase sigma-70 factor (ECF subfamily)
VSANGQPAFAEYVPDPAGIIVLTVAGDRVRGITRFLDTRLPARFDPPDGPQRNGGSPKTSRMR